MNQDRFPTNQPESENSNRPTTTEEIVRKHMEDPNHVITDDEIRNVEVGKIDEVPTVGAEAAERFGLNGDERSATDETDAPNPWVVKE
jgi:hypothetical protein